MSHIILKYKTLVNYKQLNQKHKLRNKMAQPYNSMNRMKDDLIVKATVFKKCLNFKVNAKSKINEEYTLNEDINGNSFYTKSMK